jgi:hypothetical protein
MCVVGCEVPSKRGSSWIEDVAVKRCDLKDIVH